LFIALIQAPTFSRQHTKTHTDSNRCHSERDCHRSRATQLWNADMSTSSNHTRLLSSAATSSTQWRVRKLYCPTMYVYFEQAGSKWCKCQNWGGLILSLNWKTLHKSIMLCVRVDV